MKNKEFRAAVPEAVRAALPPHYRHFNSQLKYNFVQFWYGRPYFHFEVAVQARTESVEVGLHLEHRNASLNQQIHDFLDENFIEIRAELGEIWLEKWDKGWHKLYKTFPFAAPFSAADLQTVAEEVARQIVVLQPMLREAVHGPSPLRDMLGEEE